MSPPHGLQRALLQWTKTFPSGRGFPSFRRPEFRESHYRVSADPWAYSTTQVPPRFSSLQRARATGSTVTLSSHDVLQLEGSLRRLTAILNHQHWFLGDALRTADPVHPSDLNPVHSRALLSSSQKAGSKALRWSTHLLDNWILYRRDSLLNSMVKDLDQAEKRCLRHYPLGDRFLFSPATTDEVYKTYLESMQTKTLVSAVSQPSQGQRRSSARRQGNYQNKTSGSSGSRPGPFRTPGQSKNKKPPGKPSNSKSGGFRKRQKPSK